MCDTALHINTLNNTNESFSTFSTLNLLRTCNRLMLPNNSFNFKGGRHENGPENPHLSPNLSPELNITDLTAVEPAPKVVVSSADSSEATENRDSENVKSTPNFPLFRNSTLLPMSMENFGFLQSSKKNCLPGFQYIAPPTTSQLSITPPLEFPLMELNRSSSYPMFLHRRSRGEKRPIPEEQKDEKYFERRKRNNEAAKKSRDARKLREDRIAFRAALLEQENSILRAQLISLRDELQAMRQVMSTTSKYASNSI